MSALLQSLFDRVLLNSAAGGVLALVFFFLIIATRRRIGPRWGAAFAVLIFARLVLPATPESRWSFFNLTKQPTAFPGAVAEEAATEAVLPVAGPLEWVPLPVTEAMPIPSAETLVFPAVASLPLVPEPLPAEEADSTAPGGWAVLPLVWLGGAMLLFGTAILGNVRTWIHLRRVGRRAGASAEELLEECVKKIGVRSRVSLRVLPGLDSAALFGLVRPTLLISPRLEKNFSGNELRAIFLHELAHLRRGDLWWNWVACLVSCLHWFNPLVWVVARRFRSDREQLCDRLAAGCLSDVSDYSRALLKVVTFLSQGSGSWSRTCHPGLATVVSRKSEFKHRLIMLQKSPRTSPPLCGITAVVLASACLATFTSALAEEEENRDRERAPGVADESRIQPDRDRPHPEREGEPERPRGGDRDREQPERDGDAVKPREGDKERFHPEREGDAAKPREGDGDRPHPERETYRDGDRREGSPERRDGDRRTPEAVRDGHRLGDGDMERMHRAAVESAEKATEHAEFAKHIADLHEELADSHRNGMKETSERLRDQIDHEVREFHARSHGGIPRGDGMPRPSDLDHEKKLRHLHLAAENLEQAGLTEEARRYREQAEQLERAAREHHARPGSDAERAERLEHEVRELHEVVGNLRREIEELRSQLGRR